MCLSKGALTKLLLKNPVRPPTHPLADYHYIGLLTRNLSILFWFFGVLCYITRRLKDQSSLITQMMACQKFCLCKVWHLKHKKHCVLLNMCMCIGICMSSDFLYGEKGRQSLALSHRECRRIASMYKKGCGSLRITASLA